MKRCLIIGGADCVFQDVERALNLSEFEGVVVVKRMLEHWRGPLDAFASLHPELVAHHLKQRRVKKLDMNFKLYCPKNIHVLGGRVDVTLPDWAGSSGLYAVRVALHMGFDRIVLCGVPMTGTPHFDRARNWEFAYSYHRGWRQNLPAYKDKTRSMSGWTKTLLGEPSEEWLRDS